MFDPSTLALWLTRKEPLLAVAARNFKDHLIVSNGRQWTAGMNPAVALC